MIGKNVAHYRVLEKLGEGGMGVVYLAEDTRLGRKVALKALPAEFAQNPERRQRFVQEARAAAALNHAGIAGVYALEEVGEDLYIAFEYVQGQSLRALVSPGGMEQGTLLDIAHDIAEALAAAHGHWIVHRDLKPENILRTPEGDTKILDFGLARFVQEQKEETASVRLTSAGTIVGTVWYMSPEQLEGKEPDFRADIFSFGVMLYELASGVRPFDGATSTSTISRILTAEPMPLIQRNPMAPPELDRIVRKCLRKRREERYQSTQDLKVDLENLRSDTGTTLREAMATPVQEDESSVLSGIIKLTRGSPRRWWEINNLFDITGLLLLLYFAGVFRQWIPGIVGLVLYFAQLMTCATVLSLRCYLLVAAIFNPRSLAAELGRVHPWLQRADVAMFSVLSLTTATLVPEHPNTAGGLLILVIGGLIVVLLAEPTMIRAAFPSSAQNAAVEASRPVHAGSTWQQRTIAVIQVVYSTPVIVLILGKSTRLQTTLVREWPSTTTLEKALFTTLLVIFLATIFIGVPSAIMIWRGNREFLKGFYRWFALFAVFDILPGFMMVMIVITSTNFAVGLIVFPLILAAPIWQWYLAQKILARTAANSGE